MAERRLRQPGPKAAEPFESFVGSKRRLDFVIEPGLTLIEAIARPMGAANIVAASLVLEGGGFAPFQYLMPALSTDGFHAAWYSDPHRPEGEVALEVGNATFGDRDGVPFIHCHAIWTESDGRRRAGHVLPHEAVISAPIRVTAWGVDGVRMISEPDAETGFTLFHPAADVRAKSNEEPRMVMARVRPNVDVTEAIDAICRKHGIAKATLRGSIGSLIGARYRDGNSVDDIATEVLVTQGSVSARGTKLEIVMVDTGGSITQGELLRGENPVCITFELCLEEI